MIWVILMAGGDGTRLAPEAVRRYGYARPKQFCDFGGGPLIDLTLARARRFAPDHHIVIITTRTHRNDALAVLARAPAVVHLEQPVNRDTTAGLLLPLLHVLALDPEATVVMMPTDHAFADDAVFEATVYEALLLVRDPAKQIALLAADPGCHDEDYGWLVPAPGGDRCPSVVRFREKPPREEVQALRDAGALVNTFVLVARAATLEWALERQAPESLARLRTAMQDATQLDAVFAALPASSVSRDVLEHLPEHLRIVPLPPSAGWSDVGTPERLAAVRWQPEDQSDSGQSPESTL